MKKKQSYSEEILNELYQEIRKEQIRKQNYYRGFRACLVLTVPVIVLLVVGMNLLINVIK